MPGIVSLVQLGLGGLVAAMAILSYHLMKQETEKERRNLRVYEHIHRYAKYTLLLSLVVVLGAIVDGATRFGSAYARSRLEVERRRTLVLCQHALDCRESLSGLLGSEGQLTSQEDLRMAHKLAYAKCVGVMQDIAQLESQ